MTILKQLDNATVIRYGALILALVLGVFLLGHAFLQGRRQKVQTWRVRNIPSDVPEAELREGLEFLEHPGNGLAKGVPGQFSNIRQLSFVQASLKSSTATVTFWRTPFALKTSLTELSVLICLGKRQLELVFDTHFYGMTTLYCPPNPAVDLVAVTGLAGHGLGSWKSPGRTDVWIRDYLPLEKLNARILSYGYDTTLLRSQSKCSIYDLSMIFLEALKSSRNEKFEATRPIIIIAHSLGGLLVKEALVIAGKRVDEFSHIGSTANLEIVKSCYALIFFGVPNLGIQEETLITLLKGQPNYPLIKSVVMDNDAEPSDYLKSLNRSFLESFLFEDSPVISYYEKFLTETVKINWLGQLSRTGRAKLLVSEASATHISKNKNLCDQHPIQANHSQMVKFKHRGQQDYVDLVRVLENLVYQAPMVIKRRFPRNEEILNMCNETSERFDPVYIMTLGSSIPSESQYDKLSISFELQNWLNDTNSRFIWLVRRPQLGETASSRIVSHVLNANTICVSCIQFSPSAQRVSDFSNASEMILRYILARMLRLDRERLENLTVDDHNSLLGLLNLHGNFNRQSAWNMLEKLIKAKPDTTVQIVIDGLEKIFPEEDRDDFVKNLRHLLDLQLTNMKVFMTSIPYEPIRVAFQGLQFIDPIAEYHDCLKSLGVDAYNHRQETIVPAQQYTGSWIVEHPKYVEWDSAAQSSALWLVGKPGSGKSTLLLATLKRLLLMHDLKNLANMLGRVPKLNHRSSRRIDVTPLEPLVGEKPIVAGFFYRFRTFPGEKTEASHTHMLYSLLFQILKQDIRFFPLFQQTYQKIMAESGDSARESRSWSLKELLGIFTNLVNMKSFSRRLYIILDAMDESENDSARTQLLQSITDACHSRTRTDSIVVKFIIASRPSGKIVFEMKENEKIIMQKENAKDIKRIVAAGLLPIRNGVSQLSRNERANFDIERFRSLLLRQANGVIIWVSLVLKQVQSMVLRGLTSKAMMEELENMQPDMDELYAIIVKRLKAGSQADIEKGKQWLELVSFTERSLNIREFQDAELMLRLGGNCPKNEAQLGQERLPISNLWMVEQYMMNICGGFIEVKTWSQVSTTTGYIILTSHLEKVARDGGLQLLHRTVRDFLTKDKSAPYKTDIQEGNILVAKICIQYLRLSLMDPRTSTNVLPATGPKPIHAWPISDYELFVENLNKWPLLEYSLKFLPIHLLRLGTSLNLYLDELHKVISEIRSSPPSGGFLLLASWFHTCAAKESQTTLSMGKDVRNLGTETILNFWAALSNDIEAVEGKELPLQFVTSCLVTAARKSRTWAVKILLAAGASVNVLDTVNSTSALDAAAQSGSSEIIAQLTQEDVELNQLHSLFDISRQKNSSDSLEQPNSAPTSPIEQFHLLKDQALHTAARQGNATNVSLILENGAEPDSRDEHGVSPISLASLYGAEEVVDILIRAGADFNSKDLDGQTPLMIAASKGHRRIIQLLLQAGADPNHEDHNGKSSLSYAIAGNHEGVIRDLLEAGAIGAVPIQKSDTYFMVPFQPESHFVGREEIINEVETGFATGHSRVALVGTGGVGKTQIAIQCASRLRSSHHSVFWVFGDSIHRFEQSYMDIAKVVNIPGTEDPKADMMKLVCQWLEKSASGSWLMVLDNVEDGDLYLHPSEKLQLGLASYLPRNPNGKIILTTRNRHIAAELTNKVILVDVMTESDAISLLAAASKQPFEDTELRTLLEKLGNLPLAVSQVASFLRRTYLSVSELSTMLDENESVADLLFSSDSDGNDVPNSIFKTLQVSLDLLKKSHYKSTLILFVMSFFYPDAIPFSLLESEPARPKRLSELLAPLENLSLIRIDRNRTVSIHRLVHNAIRRTMNEIDTMRFADKALRMLSAVFPSGDFEDWDTCAVLYPHANALLNFPHIEETDTKQLSNLCHNTARYLLGRGHYWLAREISERAYHLRRKIFGPESILMLASLDLLVNALQYLGEYNTAQTLYEQVSKEIEEKLGPKDARTLSTYDQLANIYRTQGRLEKAIELYTFVLESKESRASNDLNTLKIIQNLAATYQAKGEYTDAEELFKQALLGREESLGRDHPDTLTTVGSLANNYSAQGKYDEAVRLYERAIEGSEKVLGNQHPDVLGMRENLAIVYNHQARYVEAAALLEPVLVEMDHQLGPDHPDTMNARNNLAMVLFYQGRLQEAENLFELTLSQREKVLGFDHPSTLSVMNNLASVYRDQGRYAESEELYIRSLEKTKKFLGSEHPDTLNAMGNLAGLLQNKHQYEEAETLLQFVLSKREKMLGVDHPSTLDTMSNLATVLENQRRYPEAVTLFSRSLRGREKILGTEHPDTLNSVDNLASVLQNSGHYSEAIELYLRSLKVRKDVLGPDHPDTLMTMASLADVYNNQGDRNLARKYYLEVLERRNAVLGSDHPDSLAALEQLKGFTHEMDIAHGDGGPVMARQSKVGVNVSGSAKVHKGDIFTRRFKRRS